MHVYAKIEFCIFFSGKKIKKIKEKN